MEDYNKYLELQIEKLEKRNKELEDGFKATMEELTEYATKVENAIEYIENNDLYFQDEDYDYEENLSLGIPDDSKAREDLLDILKGNEEHNEKTQENNKPTLEERVEQLEEQIKYLINPDY